MEIGPAPLAIQTEKFYPHAVRRLYLAIVNRAILDVLENGQESREAKRWLLSRNFDSLQAAVGKKGERTGFPTTYMAFGSNRVDGTSAVSQTVAFPVSVKARPLY